MMRSRPRTVADARAASLAASLQFGKQRTDAPVEATALIGEGHGTRGAIKQAHSDTLLESRHRAADAGLREAEHAGCAHEIAGFDHGGRHAEPTQQAAIEWRIQR
jgi:hypothetical protein